ncbi:MAG: cytochrome P450 [Thermoleophilaceae bacterium]
MTATSLPPGPRLPVALQTARWVRRPTHFMERCRRRYGDTFSVRIAREGTWVFVTDPDEVKQVFTGDPEVLRAGEGNSVLGPLVGSNSLLLLDAPQHMRERKLMLPPFHGERMQGYAEVMTEVAEAELGSWPVGREFPAWPAMQSLTLEVIMRTVFGVEDAGRLDRLRAALRDFLDWTGDRNRLLLLAVIGISRTERLPSFRRTSDRVDELIFEEIRRRRGAPDLAEREDVLSLLLSARHEDGRGMTDQELRDELVTLLVAGHETTATALAWTFERLVHRPDVLERVRDELAAGEHAYLDAVIRETLRLRPILPIVVRKLAEPFELGGRVLPAGITVVPCIYLMHRRADVYPDPYAFRPERFLEEPPGTYTWIPFGGGVRRCLGASFALFEMRQVLATVLPQVELRPEAGHGERIVRRTITYVPEHGARIAIERRRAPVAA